mmetsp:Transcript_4895/g.7337  ORF Transcript_4895/g.7337 Transcript_4895/m.7337 type:complete len:83 (+) Transcript_4895:133-381(+)
MQSNFENLNSVQFDISQSVRDESSSVFPANGRMSNLEVPAENPNRGYSIISSEGFDPKAEKGMEEAPFHDENSQQSTAREET